MSKYTPGPWEAEIPGEGSERIGVGRKDGFLVCLCSRWGGGEAESNAKLIAASPDFADACVLFLQQLASGAIEVYPAGEPGLQPDVCEMIEAAVKKAGIEVIYE